MSQTATRFLVVAALIVAITPVPPASALTGDCAANNANYFSSVCFYKNTQFSGAYAEWPSVALNITESAANNNEFIAQHMILWDRFHSTSASMREVGDTAGGGNIGGHEREWARMWYWVEYGPTVPYAEHFIQYSPSDGAMRSYGMQWEIESNAWLIYIGGIPKATITTWINPSTTWDMQQITGLEIFNGYRELDASKNSGLFTNQTQLWRDLSNQWIGWDQRWQQVDAPCGSAPTCLQGWWTGVWNNAKP